MNNSKFLKIDGSLGEGGGQILRSSLTMSLLSKRPVHLVNIRAKRSKPGLKPQHLAAIQAASQISGSEIRGATLHSQELYFIPGTPCPGNYHFQVTTAGAMPLVLHTIALPLAFSDKPSRVDLKGGTHVNWAPTYEYLEHIWGSVMQQLGFSMKFNLHQAGYYPAGGGWFTVEIEPATTIRTLNVVERPPLRQLKLIAILSKLSANIAEREISQVQRLLPPVKIALDTIHRQYPASRPGNALFLQADFGSIQAGFTSLGERGKPAEKVAKSLVKEFHKFWKTNAAVEEHLADQLLLPLAFASGVSSYQVANISQHLLTNAHILQLFRDVNIAISGQEGESGTVTISTV